MEYELDWLLTEFSLAALTFFRVIHQLAPEHRRQARVDGSWSPQDILAHLIGWDVALYKFIVDPEGFDMAPLSDRHAFDATSVSARQHQSWDETIDEWQTSYRNVQQALSTVTADTPIYTRVCWWLRARQGDYVSHTRQIEIWMEQNAYRQYDIE